MDHLSSRLRQHLSNFPDKSRGDSEDTFGGLSCWESNPIALEFMDKYSGLIFNSFLGESDKHLAYKSFDDFEDVIFTVRGNAWINTSLTEIVLWFDSDLHKIAEATIGKRICPIAVYLNSEALSLINFDLYGNMYLYSIDYIQKIGSGIDDFWRFILRFELDALQEKIGDLMSLKSQ